ncbi:phosphatase PAP2 family protein [Halospeciosus flavus]|uniref:Phosphatase PAP2 family protein n=1 Tax=Halospeciosus flavus TaxID=3032283 RepID=A0ABD5Z7W4_9EURY|nr:phosphatase PAP2 family protein [Halospeciosus flavus]
MRNVGLTEFLSGLVPEMLVPLLFAFTQLGDPWFLMVTATLAYWVGPRYRLLATRDGARVLAVAVGVLAFVEGAKAFFGLPRPPAAVTLVPKESFAFPSGHATGSAAIYGSLGALLGRWSERARYAVAAGIAVFVSFTRLFLGVHYLLDVVVGLLLGAAFAWTVVRLTRERVVFGYVFAVAVGVAALVLTGANRDSVVGTGFALGALVAWLAVREDLPENGASTVATGVGLVVVGAISVAALRVAMPSWAVVLCSLFGGAGLVGVPAVQNFSR